MTHPPRLVGSGSTGIAEYLSMATSKAAARIDCPGAVGASCADADSTAINPALRTLGHRLNRGGERATREPHPRDRMPRHGLVSHGGPK
jgi:hypothetical protein